MGEEHKGKKSQAQTDARCYTGVTAAVSAWVAPWILLRTPESFSSCSPSSPPLHLSRKLTQG